MFIIILNSKSLRKSKNAPIRSEILSDSEISSRKTVHGQGKRNEVHTVKLAGTRTNLPRSIIIDDCIFRLG